MSHALGQGEEIPRAAGRRARRAVQRQLGGRFFDNCEDIVENDAVWAYKFQRDYNKKIKDPDDTYLEIKRAEERRKKKGLPPRLVILPGWDMFDEERYDEEKAKKRRRVLNTGQRTSRRSAACKQLIHKRTWPLGKAVDKKEKGK